MKVNKIWFLIFLAPTVILFLLIYAIPLAIVFLTSFMSYRLASPTITFAGIDNYVRLLSDQHFYAALQNTIAWILIHCTLHIALGVSLALVLYKKPFGWKFVRTAYMIPNIIPNAAIGLIFLNIYNPQFGVLNAALRALGLEHLQRNWLMQSATAFPAVTMIWLIFAGYTTILVLAHALSIDDAVLEAAKIDGATNFRLDMMIMLPLLKKIVGTTTVMAAAYMLRMFDLIFVTTAGGPGRITTNLPLYLYHVYMGEHNYGYANTIGVVIIALGILSMAVINRAYGVNKEDY